MAPRRQANLDKLLHDLLETFEPRIRDAFYEAVQNVTSNIVLGDMINAVRDGDLIRAYALIGLSPAAMRPVVRLIEELFETGGVTTGSTFPKMLNYPSGRAVYRFDVRNSRAEKWLREKSSSLVQGLEEDSRQAIREVLEEGMRNGVNPRQTALDLVGRVEGTGPRRGGKVGLDQRRRRSSDNAKAELADVTTGDNMERYLKRRARDKRFDSTVKKAKREGKKLDDATVEKIASRYNDGLLRDRAEAIARSESIEALNASEFEAISQAVEDGAAREDQVYRTWDSAGRDGRTRDSHLRMDGQIVRLNEPFQTLGRIDKNGNLVGAGYKMMYPGDRSMGAPGSETVNCRCIARTRVDWLADVEKVQQSDAEKEETRRRMRELGML